jgi:oligopeptide/dipeptide ABC transporter ATP-binding protein
MEDLLRCEHLKTQFEVPRGTVYAVDDVSLRLSPGETLGLVGESGCGKSSLGKSIARIIVPTEGTILFRGRDITRLSRWELRPFRRKIQFVFQDPFAALNPRTRVGRILEEPLIVHRMGSRRERMERIAWLMERVGIPQETMSNYPHEFSGGQRQRICIARALTLSPELLICDEPVSALDVSVQAQVLNLMANLQRDMGFSCIFITHDFSVVKFISDRIAVMYLGTIVEISTPASIWEAPLHPYTQALIAAVPTVNPNAVQTRVYAPLTGEIPSPTAPPPGCRFHTRCDKSMERCRSEEPPLREVSPGVQVACHLYAGF